MAEFIHSTEHKQDYIARLQTAVHRLHKCPAAHCATVPVHEVFRGKTVWKGDVEVFQLFDNRETSRCYAWSHREGPNDERERFVVVLEIPPVVSAETAVRVQIVKGVRREEITLYGGTRRTY
jgi:hypothetical protein